MAGSCPANVSGVTTYYGLAPLVEARLTVPSGFPSLPSGITLGWLSPVTNTSGDVAYPPLPIGFNALGNPNPDDGAPWIIYANLCSSVAAGCPLGYSNWVIGCPPP